MEPQKKNRPPSFVLIAVVILVLALVAYFGLLMFFPDLFDNLSKGKLEPVVN